MNIVIKNFQKEILDLRDLIGFIESIKEEIPKESSNYTYCKSTVKRKYDYNAIIISLYGLIEYYIEQLCYSYIESIEKDINLYSSLDKTFAENHFNLSIQLINKIINNKHIKYSKLDKDKIIKNLNNCLLGKPNYTLNKEAFTINTGNLKHSKICEIFNSMNINLNEKLKEFKEFNHNTENTYNSIDEIVRRRNEIAHGNAENLLSPSEITPFLDFTEKYIQSTYVILMNEFETNLNLFKKNIFGQQIHIDQIFRGNIIGISGGSKYNFKNGDTILIERDDKSLFSSIIIDIKKHPNTDVSIKINKNIKNNHKFYAITPALTEPISNQSESLSVTCNFEKINKRFLNRYRGKIRKRRG